MKSPQRGRETGGKASNTPGTLHKGNARARRTLAALREVLAAAQARGVALAASYQHFDRSGSGVVGVDNLMAGLVELRLSSPATVWDERDAEDCLEILTRGKSRVYCSRDDFVRFFAAPTPTTGGDSTSTKTSLNRRSLRSPTRGDLEQLEGAGDGAITLAIDGPEKIAPKSEKVLRVALPEWAHARSKRALSELESMQRRRGPRRGKQFQLSSLAASSPSSFESSQGEEDGDNNANGLSPWSSSAPEEVSRLPLKPSSPGKRNESDRVLEFKSDAADSIFAVDQEHAIAYRILTHDIDKAADTELDEETARLRAALLQALATKHGQQEGSSSDDEVPPMAASFRLTVFIDAFQRIETLAAFFEPFLVHFPRGKILVCGHPVRSDRSTVWNSSFTADAYGRLLVFLASQSREWLPQPKVGVGAVPQYLVAFGTGASAALQLLGMHVPMRASTSSLLQSFAHTLRGLVLVNSVVGVDAAVRGNVKTLRMLLQRPSTDAVPLHEACMALLFSEHYLTQVAPSRRAAMETFFCTRREFFVGSNGGGDANQAELLRLLLHGVLKTRDVHGAAANLSTLPRPFAVLIVHGSHNALFLPDQVETLIAALSSPANAMAESVAAALAANRERDGGSGENPSGAVPFHVSWLKSGHEVVQERPAFLYDLLRQLILLEPRGNKQQLTGSSDGRDGERVSSLLAEHGLKWIQQELYDRGVEGSGASDAILRRYEQVLAEEDAAEQRRLAKMARQEAKHRQAERSRVEKQRADMERQAREKETALSIARKEAESQRAFFAQMEASKLAHARLREEQQSMALEDVLAIKYENHVFLEDERRARNESMATKVAEIEAERGEVDRSKYQIQLQQERLAAQQAKREALKQFQRAFEQNELVSSAVEAYCLDASPVLEQFAALAHGARLIAKDLVHFHELKELQKDESAQRLAQLDKLREELAGKHVSQRNLERVLAKAKSTGMVAKAGLGTVRIVPVSASEVAALERQLDELRDESERVQHDLGLRAQELQWKDQLLQRLSVLIKRNEEFRAEMLGKLRVCLETGNDQVLLLREDDEQMTERLEANRHLRERLETRAQAVGQERARAERATSEYFDTRVRVEGSAQRVLRVQAVRELAQEAAQLEARMAELADEDARVQRALSASRSALDAAASRTLDVQRALEELVELARADAGESARSDRKSSVAGVENPLAAPAESAEGDGEPVAERVRRTPHAERSAEERQWVAMDFSLHFARYYKALPAEEVELIARNADEAYTCALAPAQLSRLMALPARSCLALAFLKSAPELAAHALLRKFSFGDGDEHFARLDRRFVACPRARSRPVASTLAELAAALEKQVVSRLAGDHAAVDGHGDGHDDGHDDVEHVPSDERALLDDGAAPTVSTLLHAADATLEPHESVTHTFCLPARGLGALSLTVSIVFQGSFQPAGYQPGRLAAMLYVLPPADRGRVQPPQPVGQCSSARDISLCTPHSLGRLVLRHAPDAVPLCGAARYQLVLGAPVRTRYSVDVTARTALFAGEALRRRRADARQVQARLPRRRDEAQDVFASIQLSARKLRLARAMAGEAQAEARAAELARLRAARALELDAAAAAPALGREQRLALHREASAAEQRASESSFRFAKREEEARAVALGLRELTRAHVDLLDECERMERALADYRASLPRIAAALAALAALAAGARDRAAGDAAGAREAAALDAEYEPLGARSAKLRWAELAAMKARLPSMMTPAERLRRKYRKGRDALDTKERAWVLLDRVLHPRLYDWEARAVPAPAPTDGDGGWRKRLHGAHPALSKDEQQLAAMPKRELERILSSPWTLLERKEIQIRKLVTRFRDDYGAKAATPSAPAPALLRARAWSELTAEEREWRLADRVLHPACYRPAAASEELGAPPGSSSPASSPRPSLPASVTREDLVAALQTPEEQLFTLPGAVLRARTLLLKYDPQLSGKLLEAAARGQQGPPATAPAPAQVAETDVDARCRLVYDELQRAIANTRNEHMDSSVLHATPQRFPTKVLRLELEKELDRLLRAQVLEREEAELRALFRGGASKRGGRGEDRDDAESVSESDSDEEAVVAREARDARREAGARGLNKADARGKTRRQQSIQRQRRRIRDALQPRSLEERRRLLQERELGVGGCMACRANPCAWRMYLGEATATIEARMLALHEELERVKHCADATMSSSVCLAAVQAGRGAVVLRRADLFEELTAERKRWATHLRLQRVDAEFHATFQCREAFFETRALHDFPQVQLTGKIQRALQREHNALVAQLAAAEMVEDALEAMLEGWVFGERESQRAAIGYVPSLKRDGPLSMLDLRRLEQEAREATDADADADADADVAASREKQDPPGDKCVPIEVAALERQRDRKVVQHGSALDKSLTETERALRFGIFCMTLMYFRGLAMLKRQRATWSQAKASGPAAAAAEGSAERRRMLQEQRSVARRQHKAAVADAKAQRAAARADKMQQEKAAAYRRRLVAEHQRATREARAAAEIQRTYRGHLGRVAGRRWMVRRREIDAQRALAHAAAVTLQRAYRGRLGRLEAEERRVELAEFISQLRAEEAIEEEEAYWRAHPLERAARRVAAFVKKQA